MIYFHNTYSIYKSGLDITNRILFKEMSCKSIEKVDLINLTSSETKPVVRKIPIHSKIFGLVVHLNSRQTYYLEWNAEVPPISIRIIWKIVELAVHGENGC